jgi:copper(I)-binding protein
MRFLPAIALALLAVPVAAQAPALHVSGWARATVAAQTGSAAYLTIHNAGRTADRLLAVSTPAAASASLHSSSVTGGIMRMRPAGALPIGPGQAVKMKSGGLHIMLIGLKAPLKAGQKLPLSLKFQRAGIVRTSVPISVGAPDGGHRH